MPGPLTQDQRWTLDQLSQLFVKQLSRNVNAVNVAGAGVVIDASAGDIQALTMTANVTSSSIANGFGGQILQLEWINLVSTWTYVSPTNIKWAGAAEYTHTATNNRRDIVTLRFDAVAQLWYEVSRSVNVG